MKKVRSILTALAVVFAVGGAFASMLSVSGWGKNPDTQTCSSVSNLSNDCTIGHSGTTCTITFDGVSVNAYDNASNCANQVGSHVLRMP